MALKIGIDVGGTFTDFVVVRDGAPPAIHKTLSTPADPSIAVVQGLEEIAAATDCGRETTKSRLRYALSKLRHSLQDLL